MWFAGEGRRRLVETGAPGDVIQEVVSPLPDGGAAAAWIRQTRSSIFSNNNNNNNNNSNTDTDTDLPANLPNYDQSRGAIHRTDSGLDLVVMSGVCHAEETQQQHGWHALRKEERSVFVALWILTFLAGNIFYVYYTFSHEELHNSLIFAKPNLEGFDFFDLIWAVGITDFVLKYFTIGLKCFVLFLPKILLAFKSRGKFYLLIEDLSQLFRALVPIQLWYKYIMGEDPSNSYFLGATLIIIYSLCKSFDICGRVSAICKALVVLCSSQSYGVRAGSQQCSEAGDVCAICQADFRDPVALLCQVRTRRNWFQQACVLRGVPVLVVRPGENVSAVSLHRRRDPALLEGRHHLGSLPDILSYGGMTTCSRRDATVL
ncbi:hypothetical protein F2P81_014304 [Scophthalmus maximus]|uniref:RING finger and transmembrane domain-containing protein 2 n=1 Tax=Scophthalmus maximus TaxID=52904 RepID=A0A6A4SQ68_SCOMX|nr:hypothetical protein F2P81_014304 [Scophthalmus maximus]